MLTPALALACALSGCAGRAPRLDATEPVMAFSEPSEAGLRDGRGRFRQIYCAVLDARPELPDHRSCGDALTRLGREPAGEASPVDLGPSRRQFVVALVPGIGYDCVAAWLQPSDTAARHVARFGHELRLLPVDALSGTAANARRVRDAVLAMDPGPGAPRTVLVGYSKGAPDLLEAIVAYPEIRPRLAAVVSLAGAVGGSPLADDAQQYQAELLRHFPGARCDAGDGGGVAALRTDTRRAWLAANPMPPDLPVYSVVTAPGPDRISSLLRLSAGRLDAIDPRHDGQVLLRDQIVPGSTLVAYVNADHWAIALPIARSHPLVASMFVTRNDYPREALLEAVLRFVEEDLEARGR